MISILWSPSAPIVIYSHSRFTSTYMHICMYNNSKRHNDKDARRKTQEDFFTNIFYLSLYCKGSKRLFKVCMWEGAGDRTEITYFDLHSLGPSNCVILVLLMLNRGCGVHSGGCWLSLLHLNSIFYGPQTPSRFPRAPSVGWGFPYPIWSLAVWNSPGNCFFDSNSTELNNNLTPTRSTTGSLKSNVIKWN